MILEYIETCYYKTQSMNSIHEVLGPLTFSILGKAAFYSPFISAHVSGG